MNKLAFLILILVVLTGCVLPPITTKQIAYPAMYTDNKPVSILVVPAINESTAADAGDLLNVTVTQPFANNGYYVMPVSIVSDIFKREGILEGTQVKGIPTSVFKNSFGADAVLFLTITEWDKFYAVIAGGVSVAIEYVLLSTETNEILWSYTQRVDVNTSGGSGNIIADLITTAISTAATSYVPIAFQVNEVAAKALPFGVYHPQSGIDGDEKVVNLDAKEKAVRSD